MIFFEITEAIHQAYESIRQNKLRSLLASLGVVIGISFVILMGWVLGGLDKSLQDTFNLIGIDMLYIDKWEWIGGRNWKQLEARKPITINQANEFARRVNTAEFAIPLARQWGSSIKYKNETITGISIQGTRSEYGQTSAGQVIDGRFFSHSDDQYSANVAVIGYGVYTSLFPKGDAVGRELKIRPQISYYRRC
jgi:putative ABC transport system permease protein